jgi:cation:H+ antiporter
VIVWGADQFTEHLGSAAVSLGVSSFALALLLAGAEPEELVTAVVAAVRGFPGIALGDVIGANVTICLVALGIGAIIAPLPFSKRVMHYAISGLPLGAICTWFVWGGRVERWKGVVLVLCYVTFVATSWILERHPPTLGEVGEFEGLHEPRKESCGRSILAVLLGIAAMVAGASLLVEAVRKMAHIEAAQTRVGLTIVGFATGLELVVLAWRAARRGAPEAAVAAVVGSFSYNVTMTLGAAAITRPLLLTDTTTRFRF